MPPKGLNLGAAADVEIGKSNMSPQTKQCVASGLHVPVPVEFRFAFAPNNPGPVGMQATLAACLNCGMAYDIPPVRGVGPAGGDPAGEK